VIYPGVRTFGDVRFGANVEWCEPGEAAATHGAVLELGDGCDIAGYVTMNCADSSKRCVGKSIAIERLNIRLGKQVFVGTGTVILGGCDIGDRVRIGANCTLKRVRIGDDAVIFPGVHLVGGEIPAGARVHCDPPLVVA